jgi:DNA-binding MarR family transcriptional regulator
MKTTKTARLRTRTRALSPRELATTGLVCVNLNLRRAARAANVYFEKAMRENTGLTSQRFNILMTLGAVRGIELAPLADLLVLERSTLLRNLEPLAEQGLIEDVPADSARARKVALTDAGRAALEQAYPVWQAAHAALTDQIGDDEARLLIQHLRRLTSTLRGLSRP